MEAERGEGEQRKDGGGSGRRWDNWGQGAEVVVRREDDNGSTGRRGQTDEEREEKVVGEGEEEEEREGGQRRSWRHGSRLEECGMPGAGGGGHA